MIRRLRIAWTVVALAMLLGTSGLILADNNKAATPTEIRPLRKSETTSGSVRRVMADKLEFVLKGIPKDTTFRLEKDAIVLLDGKEAAFSDLRAGDQVIVTYEKRGNDLMASEVHITRRAAAVSPRTLP